VQWTMTGEGTYVIGLADPAGRRFEYQREEAEGRVIHLAPGESRRFQLQIDNSSIPR
jgi:hypothetical protein